MHHYDILVLGGGASGLMFSAFAPEGKTCALLEKTTKLGTKILLSGGGRCNFSNVSLDADRDYVGKYLKSLPSIFHTFSSDDMVNFLVEHGLESKEEYFGKLFLKSEKPQKLIDCLVDEAKKHGVEFFMEQEFISVIYENAIFTVTTSKDTFTASHLIVATGGKSYPQIGASGLGYQLAEQFGHTIILPQPCLCGLETKEDISICTGIQCVGDVRLFTGKKEIAHTRGSVLFTHRGVSGPTIFDATLGLIGNSLSDLSLQIDVEYEGLPKKIIQHFGLTDKNTRISLGVKGLRSWEEAKVTGGGVSLSELTPYLESKKLPGLYFLGEVCDVTGRTGGYNLQRAWSSGYVCAKHFK